MRRVSTISRGLVWAAALLLTLSACATVTEPPSTPGAIAVEQARAAERTGDFAAAARAYLDAAAATGAGAAKNTLMLNAAEAYYRGRAYGQARGVLQALPAATLTAPQYTRRQTLVAALALEERNPRAVFDALKDALRPDTPPALRAEVHRLRAAAHDQAGNVLDAVRERIALAPLLGDVEAARANEQALWQSLIALPPVALEELRAAAPPPDTLSGWAALALISRDTSADTERALADWRRLYPGHPASTALIVPPAAAAEQTAPTIPGRPNRIALLLPLTGAYAKPAAAVRDGFLAAYFADTQAARPTVRIYDSGDRPEAVAALYRRAVADGAEFIIGPLAKEAVTALKQGEVTVPTLALNYAEDTLPAPPQLYQFGLSPEQEAEGVAERAWLDGRSRALVIAPAGDWGTRVAQAFAARWQQLGGLVAGTESYGNGDSDLSAPLRRLLNIDDSERRARELRALLQADLKFEPSRRGDADMIFMAGFPRPARQIPPLLKFFYAGDLPVYATSHIYEGRADPAKDRDLDGVMFADMPWLLDQPPAPLRDAVEQAWPRQDGLQRLYALGADAYRLPSFLAEAAAGSGAEFAGATGRLRLDAERRVHRTLEWARFRGGEPSPLAGSPTSQ